MSRRSFRVALAIAVGAGTVAAALAACFPDFEVSLGGADAQTDTTVGVDGSDASGDGASTDSSTMDAMTTGDDGPVSADAPAQGDTGTMPIDAGTLVRIEGGTFYFQATDYDMSTDASTIVDASAVLQYTLGIDPYEVTVGRFQQWVAANMPVPDAGDALDPSGNYPGMVWSSGWKASAQSTDYADAGACGGNAGPTYSRGDASLPMNCVNWMQALAFCWWDGHKRLPTDTEWRVVATSEGRELDYPWGNATPDCQHTISSNSSNPGPQGCGFPVDVGTADAGATRDGIYDIVGSLSEWLWDYLPTSNTYVYPANAGADYAGPDAGTDTERQWFGGDYTSYPTTLTSIQAGATYGNATESFDSNGWRCAKSLP